MAKLVAIGDSLAQGFQSGAIYRTDLSFPAMIARSMSLSIPSNFPIPPLFPGSGLPFNIEQFLRWLRTPLGSEIDLFEWSFRFPLLLEQFMDGVENLYEREDGSRPATYGGFYHNLAVWGFRVVDSFMVDAEYCQRAIDREEGWLEDDLLGLPAAPMYRTALRVLNPKLRDERNNLTQTGNLRKIIETEQNLDSLIIWLGANDCLGTVANLEIRDMPDDIGDDPQERRKYNLTSLKIFERDFNRLVTDIKNIIPNNTKVFVGTIPHITIPPITQGIPPFDGKYFDYYGRFFIDPSNFSSSIQKHLKREEARKIDQRIDDFNAIIKNLVQAQGNNWHIVDIGQVLDSLAIKRNDLTDSPNRALKDYYASKGISDHPLLQLSPIPNVLRLELRNGQRFSGGLFSLDCVHPSTIGYGIVAEAFLEEMQKAGVRDADPKRLNWQEIIAQDSLLQAPPQLWESVLETAERNATLWDVIFRVLSIG
jgi:lysophospholipase L1-like esterase